MINTKNIYKSFGELKVLQGISFNISKGEIFGLAGRSGTGKSTLLRCLNGLEPYDKGEIIIDGINIKDLNVKEVLKFRKSIGMVFQNYSLLNRLDVYKNVSLPLECWKYSKHCIDKKVKNLLKLVGLEEKIYAKPNELSGGQKQRVAIARALSMDPKILLFDEATSSLDPKTTDSILSLLDKINKEFKITIVIVSHQMDVIQAICDNMAIIEDGIIKNMGNVEDIFISKPRSLQNLIGNESLILPTEGINIELYFNGYRDTNIITEISRHINEDIYIVFGNNIIFRNKIISSVIISTKKDKASLLTDYFINNEIKYRII